MPDRKKTPRSTLLVRIGNWFDRTVRKLPGRNSVSIRATAYADTERVPEIPRLIGARAQTRTPLNPQGKIEIGEKLYDAQSAEGYIEADETVTISGHTGTIYRVARPRSGGFNKHNSSASTFPNGNP